MLCVALPVPHPPHPACYDDKGEFVDGKCVAAEQSPIIRIGEGENYGMDRGEVEVEVATVVLSSDANGEDSAEREGEGERC